MSGQEGRVKRQTLQRATNNKELEKSHDRPLKGYGAKKKKILNINFSRILIYYFKHLPAWIFEKEKHVIPQDCIHFSRLFSRK